MPTLKERASIEPPPGYVVRADRRTRSAEHWQSLTDPSKFAFTAGVGPLHYREDPYDETEAWQDIDLTVRLTPEADWDAACESNGYQVRLWQAREVDGRTLRMIAQFRRAGCWLAMAPLALVWENAAGERQVIGRPQAGITPTIDNDANTVTWADAFGAGLHYRYNLAPDQFYKTVVVQRKSALPAPTIGLAGLRLTVVLVLAWGGVRPEAFGGGVEPELGSDEAPTGDPVEAVEGPGPYPHRRVSDMREAFWMQAPRAWDSAEERHTIALGHRLERRDGRVLCLLSVPATALKAAQTVYPVYIDVDITEEQVGASTDDGYDDGSTVALTGTTLSINRPAVRNCGFRFTSVPLPAACTIDSAVATYYQTASDIGDDPNCTLYCEDADDAVTFASDDAPKDRTKTTASVAWSKTNLGASGWKDAPAITACVQEVVDRPGWASGNALVVLTSGVNAEPIFNVRTWDYSSNAFGAKLNVSYTETVQYEDAAVSGAVTTGGTSSGTVVALPAVSAGVTVGGSSGGSVLAPAALPAAATGGGTSSGIVLCPAAIAGGTTGGGSSSGAIIAPGAIAGPVAAGGASSGAILVPADLSAPIAAGGSSSGTVPAGYRAAALAATIAAGGTASGAVLCPLALAGAMEAGGSSSGMIPLWEMRRTELVIDTRPAVLVIDARPTVLIID